MEVLSLATTLTECGKVRACKFKDERTGVTVHLMIRTFSSPPFFEFRPQSWANCSAHIAATELPPGTRLNTNGAGDSFTAGLLVAAMLRNSGYKSKSTTPSSSVPRTPNARESSQQKRAPKKMTPYTLYMKEKYVSLKNIFNNDKKAIFATCNEMWEKESPEVKKLYERRALDNEDTGSTVSGASWSASDFSDPASRADVGQEYADPPLELPDEDDNGALSLEAAIQFASMVAGNHVNVETRDMKQLDSVKLLERAAIFQEI